MENGHESKGADGEVGPVQPETHPSDKQPHEQGQYRRQQKRGPERPSQRGGGTPGAALHVHVRLRNESAGLQADADETRYAHLWRALSAGGV